MIDTILFDLDNTLLDFSKAERIALCHTLQQLNIPTHEKTLIRYSQLNQQQWELLEQGKITREQVKVRRYQQLFAELGVERSAEQAARIYEKQLGIGHYFIEGAEALLEQLCGRYRLYALTNGTASVQRSRSASAGLDRFFKEIFISEEVGVPKPQKVYFDYCFARIPGFRRETAILVGDSLTSDILGGRNAGVRTVWFNPAQAPGREDIQADAQIARLKELPLLLARWNGAV